MNYDYEDNGSVVARRRDTFVPALRKDEITPLPNHEITLNVDHAARQLVTVSTNAVDRARGFQLIITPISIVVGALAVIVSLAFENEFLSFASLMIFWLTFAVVYVAGWALTALATPEAVSFYSARRQWNVIEREQVERWNHYKWQTGRTQPAPQAAPSQLRQDLRLALLIGVAVGVPLAIALIILGGLA